MVSQAIQNKYDRLCQRLLELQRVLIAFSGGVDSTLLLKAALNTLKPGDVLAITAASEIMARDELDHALRIADSLGIDLEIIDSDELSNPLFVENPENRCYHCRVMLFDRLQQIARQRGFHAVLCGANADDPDDYRPGLLAAKEFGIICPLQEAGLNKAEIRALSHHLQLPTWDKPANPCLATRIPYGSLVTREKLVQIEQAESFLHKLGFLQCRARHHDHLIRIEVPRQDVTKITEETTRRRITDYFKQLGFIYITVDLQGFRSGSGNETIKKS